MDDEQFNKVSFYVVAHSDDWQLFMNPNAYNDIVEPGSKVVFIVTTAGEAGYSEQFWLSREDGLKSSVRICRAPNATLTESSGTKTFNQVAISFWAVNNVTCYFFRIPDGNLDGSGFPSYNNQSLLKLREGQINQIIAVDNSAVYYSWLQFCTTLEMIIQSETAGITDAWINYLNPDTNINVRDHKDHIATGQAIQDLTLTPAFHQVLYNGYNTTGMLHDMPAVNLFWKITMFAAYEKAVYDGSGYSTMKEDVLMYTSWCLRPPDYLIIYP